jgi:hypothetical protein
MIRVKRRLNCSLSFPVNESFLHFNRASCQLLLLRYGSGKVIYALVATFSIFSLGHALICILLLRTISPSYWSMNIYLLLSLKIGRSYISTTQTTPCTHRSFSCIDSTTNGNHLALPAGRTGATTISLLEPTCKMASLFSLQKLARTLIFNRIVESAFLWDTYLPTSFCLFTMFLLILLLTTNAA